MATQQTLGIRSTPGDGRSMCSELGLADGRVMHVNPPAMGEKDLYEVHIRLLLTNGFQDAQ
jgi:hypothetical protein